MENIIKSIMFRKNKIIKNRQVFLFFFRLKQPIKKSKTIILHFKFPRNIILPRHNIKKAQLIFKQLLILLTFLAQFLNLHILFRCNSKSKGFRRQNILHSLHLKLSFISFISFYLLFSQLAICF